MNGDGRGQGQCQPSTQFSAPLLDRQRQQSHTFISSQTTAAANILYQNAALQASPFPPYDTATSQASDGFVSARVSSFISDCEAHAGHDFHSQVAEIFPRLDKLEFLGSGGSVLDFASNNGSNSHSHTVNDINTLDNINNWGFLPYGGTTTAVPIDPERLSLPKQCGTVNIAKCLPRKLRRSLHPSRMTRQRSLGAATQVGCSFMVKDGKYAELISKLEQCGMVRLQAEQPRVINGIFGVPKTDGGQRLIIDCRRANALFSDPEPVNLPTPDRLTQLVVRRDLRDSTLFVAKADLSDFYHCLRLPRSFWTFFGLPAVSPATVGAADRFPTPARVWPVITTLPMGWQHSVFLAQAFHLHFIATRVPALRRCDLIDSSNDYCVNRLRWSAYIDDLAIFGTDSEEVNAALRQYCEQAALFGLSIKDSKRVWATAKGVEVTGFAIDGHNLTVGVAPHKLARLARSTLTLARAPLVSAKELERVMGGWAWACLARRPSFAVFGAVYRWLSAFSGRLAPLWPSARLELALICALAPLLSTDVGLGWYSQALAVDASSKGFGVVVADMSSTLQSHFARAAGVVVQRHTETTDTAQPKIERCQRSRTLIDATPSTADTAHIEQASWTTVISKPWKRTEHINVLESTAIRSAVRFLRARAASHRRVLIFSDSAVAVASTSKGRSSSQPLLSNCRRTAALLLCSCLHLFLRWIPSSTNPADGPSRAH